MWGSTRYPPNVRLSACHSRSGCSQGSKVSCFTRVHLKQLQLLNGTWYTWHPMTIKYLLFYNLSKNAMKLEHLRRKRKSPRLRIPENIHLQTDRAFSRQAVSLAYNNRVGQFSTVTIIARHLWTYSGRPPLDMEVTTFSTAVNKLCGCYPFISQLLGQHIYVF